MADGRLTRAPRQRLEAVRAGQALFDSRGLSRVKVTREGRPVVLEVPIRSTGVWELMESLARQAPRPPVKAEWAAADSPLGRRLGLDRDRAVLLFDVTDPDYLARLADHHQEVLWQVLLAAIDAPFLDETGGPVEDYAARRRMLVGAGLTEQQAGKIFRDVQSLSRLEEETEDFFSEPPA